MEQVSESDNRTVMMGLASIDPAASYEAATIRYTITSLPCHHGSPLLRGTVVKRRSVFDRRTFRPAIDLQLTGDHLRNSQPFILLE